ncbi:DUF5107 domain-containing protein [Pontibacillus yanchengensis]|uniref:DUF5107 domain-containing protein n=2 Tax=Pontibacillus yanchengensis TaxID=462910 RepID=A0ACC7VCK7_9BACI|nr:DUF5107 domain-containing protein [Pontibacillus yanchengensis]MYL32141.1 DUF5107 domain-containing protein [Pontibacillus yanchengensis]MYL52721.1 DUF5107 domain-containing protein [Pontibacillus yanchengensis]
MIKERTRRTTYKGLRAIVVENNMLSCTFLPDYGGKLASLYDKKADYEWLYQSNENTLAIPEYGAPFPDYDSSGFDEMFPGIDQGPHPNDWEEIPDHGEVWALPWEVEEHEGIIYMQVESPRFPYRLKKQVSLNGGRLSFYYEAINTGNVDFPFIWTPHALLNITEQSTIVVPSDLNEVMSVEVDSEHLGGWGHIHTFPMTTSKKTNVPHNLAVMERKEAGNIEKFYFTKPLKEGWCGVEQSDIGRKLTYTFPPEKVPYLGVWKTHGGYRGDYNFALEPCTGVYDDVYVADKINKVSRIPTNGSYEWTFTMEIGGL